MRSLVFAISGVEAYPVDFRTPLVWFGLAFGLLAVVALVWIALGSLQRRLTGHHVRCPLTGGEAHLFVERNAAGEAVDVVRCSRMSPPSDVTCDKECMRHLARA